MCLKSHKKTGLYSLFRKYSFEKTTGRVKLTLKSQKFATFSKKFQDKYINDEKYRRVRDHCHYKSTYRDATHSICNLKYSIAKKMSVVFTMNQTMIIFIS